MKLANATGPLPSASRRRRARRARSANDRHQASAAGEPLRAGGGEPRDLAPADEALAVAHPAQRVRRPGTGRAARRVVHRTGPHAQPGRQRGDGHLSESRDAARPTPVRAERCGGRHVADRGRPAAGRVRRPRSPAAAALESGPRDQRRQPARPSWWRRSRPRCGRCAGTRPRSSSGSRSSRRPLAALRLTGAAVDDAAIDADRGIATAEVLDSSLRPHTGPVPERQRAVGRARSGACSTRAASRPGDTVVVEYALTDPEQVRVAGRSVVDGVVPVVPGSSPGSGRCSARWPCGCAAGGRRDRSRPGRPGSGRAVRFAEPGRAA